MERRKVRGSSSFEAVRADQRAGVSYPRPRTISVWHQSQLRELGERRLPMIRKHAFSGPGQMKPEQLEIAQLSGEGSG